MSLRRFRLKLILRESNFRRKRCDVMNRKLFLLGFILIIVFGLCYSFEFGEYYSTPEEALMHYKSDAMAYKNIIDTAWLQDEPVILYISTNNSVCDAEFTKKFVGGKLGWKVITAGALPTAHADSNITVPTKMLAKKHTNNSQPNRVLFGYTKSAKANSIKVNGNMPIFRQFELNGDKCTLWYIVGSEELEFNRVHIISD